MSLFLVESLSRAQAPAKPVQLITQSARMEISLSAKRWVVRSFKASKRILDITLLSLGHPVSSTRKRRNSTREFVIYTPAQAAFPPGVPAHVLLFLHPVLGSAPTHLAHKSRCAFECQKSHKDKSKIQNQISPTAPCCTGLQHQHFSHGLVGCFCTAPSN